MFHFNRDNPCGHYRLDLANEHTKTILKYLSHISVRQKQERQEAKLLDLSQHGNYECFRNERLDNASVEINSEHITAQNVVAQTNVVLMLQKKGVLEFDFVPARRPAMNAEECSEKEIQKLVVLLKSLKKNHNPEMVLTVTRTLRYKVM